MRKVIILAVTVVLLITAFAVVAPVGAIGPPPPAERTVYEANIVPTSWGTEPLDEGEVKVFADGSVLLKIEGALASETYHVWFGQQAPLDTNPGTWTVTWAYMGDFATDDEGDGEFTLISGSITSPVMAPVFAINRPKDFPTYFVSGF